MNMYVKQSYQVYSKTVKKQNKHIDLLPENKEKDSVFYGQ